MRIESQKDQPNRPLPGKASPNYLVNRKINAALLDHVYKQGRVGLGASLLSATVILMGLVDTPRPLQLLAWYGVSVGISLLRFLATVIYNRQSFANVILKINFWKTLFITGALSAGVCWGYLASIMLPIHHLGQFSLTLFIIAGITAGSVPLLCGIRGAVYSFISAILIPMILAFILMNQRHFHLFAGALIVYYAYLLVLAKKTYEMIKTSIGLRYENDLLVQSLSTTKQELEEINSKLEHAARHDPLTNLANRTLFEINFENAILRAQQERKLLALLYLDIDKFKEVNDVYGHHVGDELLQKVVHRIKRKLPENVIASRLGGDELAIILENVNNLEEVGELCRKICETIAKPFEIKDYQLFVSTSIGVSIYPVDGMNLEMLVRMADKAMYHCKETGGNNFHFNTDFKTLQLRIANSFKSVDDF